MRKALYIDALCPSGHKVFNSLTLDAISTMDIELKIVATHKCIPERFNIDFIIPERYFARSKRTILPKISYRIREYRKWQWILNVIDQEEPNLIFVSSYESISFSLISNKIRVPVLAFNHNNIDELTSKAKRIFYRKISKNIIQVVFEDYMAEYLKIIGIKNNVVVLPHIVDPVEIMENKSASINSRVLTLFAPSSSNDFTIIESLKRRKEDLKRHQIRLIAKFTKDFEDDHLILRKRFSDEEYSKYMRICSLVYVPLPNTFNYRVSNVINEAVANGKRVVAHRNKYTEFLKKRYPPLIYVLSDGILNESERFQNWIVKSGDAFVESRVRFLKDHSKTTFKETLGIVIDKNCK